MAGLEPVDTAEGDGENDELHEWLTANNLNDAENTLKEKHVTMEELKEIAVESDKQELKSYAKTVLKLDVVQRNRFVKAMQSLKSDENHPQQPKVIRIVLSTEEEAAIDAINKQQQVLKTKIITSTNDVNKLHELIKSNEKEAIQFKTEVIEKLSARIDQIINESTEEIKKKEETMNGYIDRLKGYDKVLQDANSKCDELLHDENMDKSKRKIKIGKISENVLKTEIEDLNIIPKVTIDFDKTNVLKYIDNIGKLHTFKAPPKPVLIVKDIKASSATVGFSNIDAEYEVVLEVSENHKSQNDDDDDEKKQQEVNWRLECSVKNQDEYVLENLLDNMVYGIRGKYKNKYGFSNISKVTTFKTSICAARIISKWSTQFKGSNIELSENNAKAIAIEQGHSVRAEDPIVRGKVTKWEIEAYTNGTSWNFFGVISSEQTNFNQHPNDSLRTCWGVDDQSKFVNRGSERVSVQWDKPKFPLREKFQLKFSADWKDKQCKLTIWYQDKKINPTEQDYSFLLPALPDKYEWYPCVTPYNANAWAVFK